MEFLARLLDTKSPLSSKRFFGGIGFLAAIVFIAIWQHDLINELLYVSASLIGWRRCSPLSGAAANNGVDAGCGIRMRI